MKQPNPNPKNALPIKDYPAKALAKKKANRTDAAGRSGFGATKKESNRMFERNSNVSEYMYDESTRKKMKRQGK